MIVSNWDLLCLVKIESDQPEEIANLLEDIARAIRKGKLSDVKNPCVGMYGYIVAETGIVSDETLKAWYGQVSNGQET
jgi:hypothetical protein